MESVSRPARNRVRVRRDEIASRTTTAGAISSGCPLRLLELRQAARLRTGRPDRLRVPVRPTPARRCRARGRRDRRRCGEDEVGVGDVDAERVPVDQRDPIRGHADSAGVRVVVDDARLTPGEPRRRGPAPARMRGRVVERSARPDAENHRLVPLARPIRDTRWSHATTPTGASPRRGAAPKQLTRDPQRRHAHGHHRRSRFGRPFDGLGLGLGLGLGVLRRLDVDAAQDDDAA